jgi:hypothetical protein
MSVIGEPPSPGPCIDEVAGTPPYFDQRQEWRTSVLRLAAVVAALEAANITAIFVFALVQVTITAGTAFQPEHGLNSFEAIT